MSDDLRERVSKAIAHFWLTRREQESKQGSTSGQKDYGNRSAVTGGKQMDGFVRLVRELLVDAGLPEASVHLRRVTIPGYFRPVKAWDLLAVVNGKLLASIEFKSQVGSFGNNYNNRVEEAIGSATDLWTAFEKGKFQDSMRPWLGWMMVLEDCAKSRRSVSVKEPHFKVFEEFRGASYAQRYEQFCLRLVRRRLYDAACFILTPRDRGAFGEFSEPNEVVSFARFEASLVGHATGYVKLRDTQK